MPEDDEMISVLEKQAAEMQRAREQTREIHDQNQKRSQERDLTRTDQLRMNAIGNAIALWQKGLGGREDDALDGIIENAKRILDFVTDRKSLN